ncbi:lysophospholipid acyltransferase family protein [Kouleothrix sp.]|uniref:lysophospholipid acyltransferase family protein n=1 Tax=Kouleothrix sp. TaxID=2779161 RepID=UPI00391A3E31
MDDQANDLSTNASAAPRCQAITRSGQPCRNRALGGQRFCRQHAALAAPDAADEIAIEVAAPAAADEIAIEVAAPAAADEIAIEHADAAPAEPAPADDPLAQIAAEVQELEVEIRNHTGAGNEQARDMAGQALRLIRENLRRMAPEALQRAITLIRQNVSSDYLDPDFWRGVSMVLRYQVEEVVGMIQRRRRGEHTTDAYGMDAELVELVRPFSTFMYRTYWRTSSSGLEHVPAAGPALLLANHGGVLPWDSMMIATSVLEEHSSPRVVRSLYPPAFRALPGVATALETFGQVADTPENGAGLLADGQLVCIFPEGVGGLGKLFRNRYRLQRFRRNGSVGLAIAAGAPIVPVAVVGSEETYPMLADAHPLAQMLRLPFFPLTPLFPWLGPLGLLPLPSRWSLAFGEPIDTSGYGADAATDTAVLGRLAGEARDRLQALLDAQLARRESVF